MNRTFVHDHVHFFKVMLKSAIENGELVNADATDERVAAMVARNMVVAALWPNTNAPNGVMTLPVKGWDELQRGEFEGDVSMTVLPRVDEQAAVALQAQYGSPHWPRDQIKPDGGLAFRGLAIVAGRDMESKSPGG